MVLGGPVTVWSMQWVWLPMVVGETCHPQTVNLNSLNGRLTQPGFRLVYSSKAANGPYVDEHRVSRCSMVTLKPANKPPGRCNFLMAKSMAGRTASITTSREPRVIDGNSTPKNNSRAPYDWLALTVSYTSADLWRCDGGDMIDCAVVFSTTCCSFVATKEPTQCRYNAQINFQFISSTFFNHLITFCFGGSLFWLADSPSLRSLAGLLASTHRDDSRNEKFGMSVCSMTINRRTSVRSRWKPFVNKWMENFCLLFLTSKTFNGSPFAFGGWWLNRQLNRMLSRSIVYFYSTLQHSDSMYNWWCASGCCGYGYWREDFLVNWLVLLFITLWHYETSEPVNEPNGRPSVGYLC